jgi:hypothetical protein
MIHSASEASYWQAKAQEWEAKYHSIAAAIDDPKLIETAEKLVEAIQRVAIASSRLTFDGAMHAMLTAVQVTRPALPPLNPAEVLNRTVERFGEIATRPPKMDRS